MIRLSLSRLLLVFLFALVLPAWAQVPAPPEPPQAEEREESTSDRRAQDVVVVGNDVVIKADEIARSIVVVGGSLRMDGEVERDIVVVAGEAAVNGPVGGNLIVVAGPVTVGPKTKVDGDAVFVGSSASVDTKAEFDHGYQRVPAPDLAPVFRGAQAFASEGVMKLRLLPPGVRWVWIVHLAVFLAILGISLLFPRAVSASTEAIEERPIISLMSGVLTAILFFPVLLLLSITVIGIPLMIVGLIGALIFGKAAVMQFIGQGLGRGLRLNALQSPILAIFVGALILTLFYITPILGFVAWGLATLLGLGAAVVAIVTALSERPTQPAPGVVPAYAGAPSPLPAGEPVIAPALTGSETIPPPVTPVVLNRVGFWKRTLAALLDWLLLIFPFAAANAFAFVVPLAYFVGMWTWKGTTIGKLVLGLKIVRLDGGEINFAVALVRCLASFFSAAVFFLGFFWAGWDREKQSWHDKIAGTVVVQVPRGMSLL